eukprot:GHVP01063143.1.p1 GENE.GHVP01063143.1~~GHVP01063143.1.p1  ORF type:complete len:566 (+),score=112.86 GHVP01063143.1:23-1699(+)
MKKKAKANLKSKKDDKKKGKKSVKKTKEEKEVKFLKERITPAKITKDDIALIAFSICGDPYNKLELMSVLFEPLEPDVLVPNVSKDLILASVFAILSDLVPNYRVASKKSFEGSATKHKEAAEILFFQESKMIEHTSKALEFLKNYSHKNLKLSSVLLAKLLSRCPRFNLAPEMLKLLLRFFNRGNRDGSKEVADACLDCLKTIVESDFSMEITKLIVKAVFQLLDEHLSGIDSQDKEASNKRKKVISQKRGRKGLIDGRILLALSSLNLEEIETATRREAQTRGDSEKENVTKDRAELKDVHTGSVSMTLPVFIKNRNSLLKSIFLCLLKILRNYQAFNSSVIEGTFKCIGNLSINVNVELMTEIFKEIRMLARKGAFTEPGTKLLSSNSALRILSNVHGGLSLEQTWICALLCQSINFWATKSKKNRTTISEYYLSELKETVELLLKSGTLESGAQGTHSTYTVSSLADLIVALMGAAASFASDSKACIVFLSTAKICLPRCPQLWSLFSSEGMVFSCIEGSKCVAKQLAELENCGNFDVMLTASDMKAKAAAQNN